MLRHQGALESRNLGKSRWEGPRVFQEYVKQLLSIHANLFSLLSSERDMVSSFLKIRLKVRPGVPFAFYA